MKLTSGLRGLLVLLLCLTSEVQASEKKDGHPLPKLEFSVIGDTHLEDQSQEAQDKFVSALKDLHELNPRLHALVINGDITASGLQSDYDCMNRLLKQYPHPPRTLFTIGNHEFYAAFYNHEGLLAKNSFPNGFSESQCIDRFVKNTGMPNVYYDAWVHGYHFIMLGPEQSRITNPLNHDNAVLSETQLRWLDLKLRTSPSTKPIFVFIHHPISNTVVGSYAGDFIVNSDKLRDILLKHPQVVLFSGHTHRTLYGYPVTMYRGEVTVFNNSSVFKPVNDHGYRVGDSEGLYIQVYDTKVTVKGRDFTHKAWIESFTIPVFH